MYTECHFARKASHRHFLGDMFKQMDFVYYSEKNYGSNLDTYCF